MTVAYVSIFGILLAFVIISAVVGLIIYSAIYNARIRRRLSQGITTGKQWPQPKNILMIILITSLSIVCIVSVISAFPRVRNANLNVNNIGTVESYQSYELKGSPYEHYIEAYETGKLTGYTLTEASDDEFSYKYFRSDSYFNLLHPSFVLFVEYTGDENLTGYIDSASISYGKELGTSSMECSEVSDYFCVIGNVNHNEGHSATYQLNLYKTEADATKEFNRVAASEEIDEPIKNAEKTITFITTEEGVSVLK